MPGIDTISRPTTSDPDHLIETVADPGPLTLGVLDRWTPTVNILKTLIVQISLHTYMQEIKLAYTAPLSSWSYG